MNTFDAIIIGAGPGGYVAAIRAAQLGLKVAIVEEKHLGGICLNWGCIPTKALLRSGEVAHLVAESEAYGITTKGTTIHFDKIIERSRQVAQKLSQGIGFLMKKNKITVLDGRGVFLPKSGDLHTLQVGDQKVQAKNIVVATGARARPLPIAPENSPHVWSYREAMTPKELPKKLLVIGSGAIGIEFASFYNSLGTKVTVLEMQDRILPVEDLEISTLARKAFEKNGITIHTQASLKSLKDNKSGIDAEWESKGENVKESFDKVIIAIGIMGNTENLGLEHTQVQTDRGQILVNEFCQTHTPGIYAIGDVAGAPWLAHKASHEGVLVAEKMAGHKVKPMNKNHIPGCTYSNPQIASIGLTEDKAKADGHTIKVGRFPFQANGKAIALGEPEGLIKVIFDQETGALLGAHMIGTEVTEMIQGFAIALACEATEQELMHTIFPHPTLSEMMHESTLDAFGQALHI